jgi:membrane protein implicated in regulation of membrane protease activity
MRGAPWQGMFYGFVLDLVIGLGAFVYALSTPDFLARTIAWAVFALVVVLAIRTIRRVVQQGDDPDLPVGRWWFGG